MGNEQSPSQAEISPKIKKAISIFNSKLTKLESSKEQRSLIIDSKVSKQFESDFNLNQWIHIARYVLENDKIIANIRQKCVPSMIKEDAFWMKYFYLVKEEKRKKKKKKTKAKSIKPTKPAEEEEEESFQVLLHKPIVWLYKISGTMWRGRNNKCELWGLRNPIWSGRLRIVAFNHGKHLELQFLEKDGSVYLKSTRIKLEELSVDDDSNPIHQYFDAYGVIDSSRYFIVWVDVPSKHKKQQQRKQQFDHKIPFGFGIRERQDAFDIRATVADQMKFVQRDKKQQAIICHEEDYESVSGDGDALNEQEEKTESHIFKLEEDEMISIGHDIDNIDNQTEDALQRQQKHSVVLKMKNIEINTDALCVKLTPPPSPTLTPANELKHKEENGHNEDDDFGEFQMADDNEEVNETEDYYANFAASLVQQRADVMMQFMESTKTMMTLLASKIIVVIIPVCVDRLSRSSHGDIFIGSGFQRFGL